jgi:superfamily II DNA or RNA helicase
MFLFFLVLWEMCEITSQVPLRPHQLKVIKKMEEKRGQIINHSVGSGKSLTAVGIIQCHLYSYPKDEVHIVTSKTLIDNFKNEINKFGLEITDSFFFWTYQSFANQWRDKRFPSKSIVVVDEAHNLRTKIYWNSTTKKMKFSRASVVVEACIRARKVICLTATLVVNKPYDIVNLIAMVDGDYPMTEAEFEISLRPRSFSLTYGGKIDFYQEGDNEHYPTLKRKMVNITMTPSYFEEYLKVEQSKSHILKLDNPFLFLTGIREASDSLDKECMKCDYILQKTIKEGIPRTVIYSSFIKFGVKALQKEFDREEIRYVTITGEQTKNQRTKANEMYNNDEVRVIFITQAGREGINLLETRNLFLMDLPWNEATEEQIEGRVSRYGSHDRLPLSDRVVNIYYLVMVKPKGKFYRVPSADQMMLKIIDDKREENEFFLSRLEALDKGILKKIYGL